MHAGKQASLEPRSNTGDTPLTLAAYFGHVHAVEKLLAMGANAMAMDDDGHAAGEKSAFLVYFSRSFRYCVPCPRTPSRTRRSAIAHYCTNGADAQHDGTHHALRWRECLLACRSDNTQPSRPHAHTLPRTTNIRRHPSSAGTKLHHLSVENLRPSRHNMRQKGYYSSQHH